MKNHERFGKRIVGANKVVDFLRKFFRQKGGNGEEDMRKYFASWSPYRIRKVHVEHIGKNGIYRLGSELDGIDGTRVMYHFAGANIPSHQAATTTDGLQDIELV
ncbi:unnamed protein product, partial [Pylaiella littoralis]